MVIETRNIVVEGYRIHKPRINIRKQNMTKDEKKDDRRIGYRGHKLADFEAENLRAVASTLVGRELLRTWKRKDSENPDIPPMTPLKIVNLAYISHGIYMAFYDGLPLVSEKVMAWDHGPIFPELFNGIMGYTSKKGHVEHVPLRLGERGTTRVRLNYEEKQMIEAVYEAHKFLGDSQIIYLTTSKGTPWYKTTKESPNADSKNVNNNLIYKFYREMKGAVLS